MKTLLLSPDCKLSDDELMKNNTTIANPTNKKVKTEEDDYQESSVDKTFKNKIKSEVVAPTERVLRPMRQ